MVSVMLVIVTLSTFGLINGGSAVNIDNANVDVEIQPYNAPIFIPSSGGSFEYRINITNNEGTVANFDLWTTYTLPGGTISEPVYGPENFNLQDSWIAYNDLALYVTGDLLPGNYTYNVNVGSFNDSIWNSDNFTFEKKNQILPRILTPAQRKFIYYIRIYISGL